mmetsp:Transcript_7333/g.16142  ORF Transcript_7333/g.16142 Transcript_7333/m.16142 type:complete len:177 (+) Transcript_7333:485-1015(+)
MSAASSSTSVRDSLTRHSHLAQWGEDSVARGSAAAAGCAKSDAAQSYQSSPARYVLPPPVVLSSASAPPQTPTGAAVPTPEAPNSAAARFIKVSVVGGRCCASSPKQARMLLSPREGATSSSAPEGATSSSTPEALPLTPDALPGAGDFDHFGVGADLTLLSALAAIHSSSPEGTA